LRLGLELGLGLALGLGLGLGFGFGFGSGWSPVGNWRGQPCEARLVRVHGC